jgi:hypothetical protein
MTKSGSRLLCSRHYRNAGNEERAGGYHISLAALGVAKKGAKQKPTGGQPRGPRKAAPAGAAGGAGAGRSTLEALGLVYARDWIKCYMCRQWGQHIAAECTRTQQEIDNLTPGGKLPPSGLAKDSLFNPN